MKHNLKLKNTFEKIRKISPHYLFAGGAIQVMFISCLFIPVIGWIISLLIAVYLCGYYLVSIKQNIDTDDFIRVDWREKYIIFAGIKALAVLILYFAVLYAFIMILALIIFIPFLLFVYIIGIKNCSTGYGWIHVFVIVFAVNYFLYPYLILTLFPTFANYIIEDRLLAPFAIKKIFKIFITNWKYSLKILGVFLLITPLTLIPFAGFYFAMVLVKITSNYITVVKRME